MSNDSIESEVGKDVAVPPFPRTVQGLLDSWKDQPQKHSTVIAALTLISTDSWTASSLVDSFQDNTIVSEKELPVYVLHRGTGHNEGFLIVSIQHGEKRHGIIRFQIDAKDHLTHYKVK
jgi:hypothetical protein